MLLNALWAVTGMLIAGRAIGPHHPPRLSVRSRRLVASAMDHLQLENAKVMKAMLEEALQAAVASEDYAGAARLKGELEEAAVKTELAALKKADNHQRHLLKSVDTLLKSNRSGVTVVHWTSAECMLPNSMVRRVASNYASARVAFVALTERGVEQLGGTHSSVKGEASTLLPAGWREEHDPVTGQLRYIGPHNQTMSSWPLTEAAGAARELFEQYTIDALPTTQVWRDGELLRQVGSVELEALLKQIVAEDNLYDKPPGVAGDCA